MTIPPTTIPYFMRDLPPHKRPSKLGIKEVHKPTWWIGPSNLLLFLIAPLYFLLAFFPHFSFYQLIDIKVPIYFTGKMLIYGLVPLIGMFLGCLVPLQNTNERRITQQEIRVALDITAALALIGYFFMFQPILFHPAVLKEIFSSSEEGSVVYAIKASMATGGGLNSLAQIGLIFFTIFFSTVFQDGPEVSRRHYYMLAVLGALTIFRAFFTGERLALIEAVAPLALCYVRRRDMLAGSRERFLIGIFPVVAFFGLLVLFGATEYLRSWQFIKNDGMNFSDFVLSRVLTYYFTALNNGALILQTTPWPTYNMFNILNWLYRLPGAAPFFIEMAGPKVAELLTLLDTFGDPEYNNPSGVFPILSDLGLVGGLFFSFVMGAWLSYLYRSFLLGRGWSGFYYPCIYLTTIEMLRVFYLGSSKFVMQVLFLWFLSYMVKQLAFRGKKARNAGVSSPIGRLV